MKYPLFDIVHHHESGATYLTVHPHQKESMPIITRLTPEDVRLIADAIVSSAVQIKLIVNTETGRLEQE